VIVQTWQVLKTCHVFFVNSHFALLSLYDQIPFPILRSCLDWNSLIVAIVAFESPWKHKLWGMVIGLLIIQTINLIRIISLYYIGDWLPDYFVLIHEQVWPILLNISMILIFGGWLFYTMTHSTKS